MIRIGCVGCGPWGMTLLKVWGETPGAAVAGVCRRHAERLPELEDRFPGVPHYETVEAMLADDAIDAVSIAAPPVTHFEIARAALKADKHVFVEKPMCLAAADAEILAKLADEQGKTLMVGHLLAYSGPARAIAKLIAEGAIGRVRHLEFRRLKLGRVRQDENVMWSFAVHDLAILRRLVPGAPATVAAWGKAHMQPDVEDIVSIGLEYPDGMSAQVNASWVHPYTVRDMVAIGTEGAIFWDDMAADSKVTLERKWVQPDLQIMDGEAVAVPYEEAQPLQEECRHFVECVAAGTRPFTDGWDGVHVVRTLEAADAALKSGEKITL